MLRKCMPALLLCCLLFGTSTALRAQITYSENFDSYPVGGFITQQSPDWKPWVSGSGTLLDAVVSDKQALSGKHSLEIAEKPNGYLPAVTLPLQGGNPGTGLFQIRLNFFIPEGNNGFIRFSTAGDTRIFNFYCHANNAYYFVDQDFNAYGTAFGTMLGKWNEMLVRINHESHTCEVFINGLGLYSFPYYGTMDALSLGSVDQHYLPMTMYIDDISYTYQTSGSLTDGSLRKSLDLRKLFIGNQYPLKLVLANTGTNPIQSFRVKCTYANTQFEESFNLSAPLDPQDTFSFATQNKVIPQAGGGSIQVEITDINGQGPDAFALNDKLEYTYTILKTAVHKGILYEEGGATWCGPCIASIPYIKALEQEYKGRFIPVAVHTSDEYALPQYEQQFLSAFGIQGIPAVIKNRQQNILYPSYLEEGFYEILESPEVKARISISASFNQASRELQLVSDYEALADLSPDYRYLMIITEDEVAGFYEHIARYLLDHFYGTELGSSVATGNNYQVVRTLNIDPGYDTHKMNLIAVLLRPDGEVENAYTIPLDEALELSPAVNIPEILPYSAIVPNPSSGETSLQVEAKEAVDLELTLLDLQGKRLWQQPCQLQSGSNRVELPTQSLPNGTYLLQVRGKQVLTSLKVEIIR